jgi:DNA-binding NtrC family response regulator
VLELLAAQAWPGNVRQLEQVIRRTIIDTGSLTDAAAVAQTLRNIAPHEDAPHRPTAPPAQGDLVALDEIERRHISSILRATGGNQTQAAFILGIERKTLARKIKRLDISIENP